MPHDDLRLQRPRRCRQLAELDGERRFALAVGLRQVGERRGCRRQLVLVARRRSAEHVAGKARALLGTG